LGNREQEAWNHYDATRIIANKLRDCSFVGIGLAWEGPVGSSCGQMHVVTAWGDDGSENPYGIFAYPDSLVISDSDNEATFPLRPDLQAYKYQHGGGCSGWCLSDYDVYPVIPYIMNVTLLETNNSSSADLGVRVVGTYEIMNEGPGAALGLHYKVGSVEKYPILDYVLSLEGADGDSIVAAAGDPPLELEVDWVFDSPVLPGGSVIIITEFWLPEHNALWYDDVHFKFSKAGSPRPAFGWQIDTPETTVEKSCTLCGGYVVGEFEVYSGDSCVDFGGYYKLQHEFLFDQDAELHYFTLTSRETTNTISIKNLRFGIYHGYIDASYSFSSQNIQWLTEVGGCQPLGPGDTFPLTLDWNEQVLYPDVLCLGTPDFEYSSAGIEYPKKVSLMVLPDGSGPPLSECRTIPDCDLVDATITVTLHDAGAQPIQHYPASRLSIGTVSGGLVVCPFTVLADADTDVNGMTTFSGPIAAGGSSDNTGLDQSQILVSGWPMWNSYMNVYFNSPDISGDLVVNLTDVIFFAKDYFGPYDYESDFKPDGTIDLTDLVLLAQGMGASCTSANINRDADFRGIANQVSIGLYDDPEGKSQTISARPDEPFDIYLLLKSSDGIDSLRGWECRLELPPNVRIVRCDLNGKAVNAFETPVFMVGLAEALPSGKTVQLATCRCVVKDTDSAVFNILPFESDTTEGQAPRFAYMNEQDEAQLVTMRKSAVLGRAGVFIVNPTEQPGSSPTIPRTVLHPVQPNPFNPHTTIRYELAVPAQVTLRIFDLSGRQVITLVNGIASGAGRHEVTWDGCDETGSVVAAGVYCCQLEAGTTRQTQRLTLVK